MYRTLSSGESRRSSNSAGGLRSVEEFDTRVRSRGCGHVFRSVSRLIWKRAVVISLLSGCTATSMMVGVSEPDLTKIQPSDQRSQAEKTLGERLWRAGLANGVTYDIYEYEAAQPARPFWGMGMGVAEALTFGSAEMELHNRRKMFCPFKQVAIAYDAQDRVLFVSRPWSVVAPPPCRRMRSLLPADSGVPSTARPSLAADRPDSASKVAILKLGRAGTNVTIDSFEPEGRLVELTPGLHKVNYADVEILPGREYILQHEEFFIEAGDRTYERVFWIEDIDSGETLYCSLRRGYSATMPCPTER